MGWMELRKDDEHFEIFAGRDNETEAGEEGRRVKDQRN